MSRARMLVLVQGIAAVVTGSAGVRAAHACGGLFCNRPPPDGSLPIAQAAENVLFVMDTDPATGAKRVEAHIQILYTGPASAFSWIVPVTAVPTVDVGWDVLFDRIEPPTRPSFRLTYRMEGTCQGFGGDTGCGVGERNAATGGGGPGNQPPPVDVLSQGSIGPYDYVVVRSENGATLRTWLTDNGYFVSDDAGRIVDEYVAGGHSFVAVKLQQGQDTSAIRPIILRLASTEACLPLKLTAIAATPDLRINVWVLAAGRAIPINFAEIAVNLAKIDWFNFGRNYDQLMKEAANEAMGNAFAVEYAQPSAVSATWFAFPNPSVRAGLSTQTTPVAYLNALAANGVTPTGAALPIVRKYIPEPASLTQGVTEAQFYSNIQYYWDTMSGQFAPFDPVALTKELETEILQPMDMLRPLFEHNAYLTRLATFISPEEMTKDPLFVTNRLLSDVSPQHTAIGHVLCGDEEFNSCAAPIRIVIEDGRGVVYPGGSACGGTVARADIDAMPSAEVGWIRDPDTEGQMVIDNRAAITQALAAHNAKIATPDSGCSCALAGRPRNLAMVGLACGAIAVLFVRRRRRG